MLIGNKFLCFKQQLSYFNTKYSQDAIPDGMTSKMVVLSAN
jgi:hypothetical protein